MHRTNCVWGRDRASAGLMGILALLLWPTWSMGANEPIVFSVMGDIPYTKEAEPLMQKHIADHNRLSKSEFMVHVGDIKSGKTPCDEAVYMKVKGYLKEMKIPTFIIPGDNEYNDCTNPKEAWGFWVKHYTEFEKNWPDAPKVDRQEERHENFAWTNKGVLFIGINLVGGRVHDKEEWATRLKQDADWVQKQFEKEVGGVRAAVVFAHANPTKDHDDFIKPFRESAKTFAKPILFIHGDGHVWIKGHPWPERNILRVQVDEGQLAPPVQVTVTLDEKDPFVLDRTALGYGPTTRPAAKPATKPAVKPNAAP